MGKENVLRPARGMKIAVALAASGLTFAVAACGSAPSTPSPTASANKAYLACMVTDQGGLDDKSFNASAWKGMQNAAATTVPGVTITVKNVASTTAADYEPNLTGFVNQKCNYIQAVGGLMGDATTKIAKANPNAQFGIVDSGSGNSNIYPMQFDTAQAAFLAGYLAAGYSKSGKVGTYGGLKIPPVTIFMDGFADGVKYYNTAKSKNVQVLGWDKAAQAGSYAGLLNGFNTATIQSAVANSGDLQLTVTGTGFTPSSTVYLQLAAQPTTYVDSNTLIAHVAAFGSPGTYSVSVEEPGGDKSTTLARCLLREKNYSSRWAIA